MQTIAKALLIAGAVLTFSATASSAAVVCNRDGDCWRVKGRPSYYGPDLGLRIYGDSWRWKRGENYRWRDTGRGRGYYRGGSWVTIRP